MLHFSVLLLLTLTQIPPAAGCEDDSDCKAGRTCDGGTCVWPAGSDVSAVTPTAGCQGDFDCKGGRVCRDGACVSGVSSAGCQSDYDCKGGRVCRAGSCKSASVAAPPAPGCTSDLQCKGGRRCQDGACIVEAPVVVAPPPRMPPAPVARAKAAPDEDRFALVIGITDYQQELPRSTGSENDAREFAQFVEDSLGVPRRNIALKLGARATRSAIDAYLDEWLPKNLGPKSTLYVFFAGHGAPDPESGDSYLIPWEADPRFVKSQGVRLTSFTARIQALPGTQKFVFLDSCFSGSGGRSVLAQGTRPLVPVSADFAGKARQGTVIFTATRANETTGTTPDDQHGLFSYFLVKGMDGDADRDRDGAVTVKELQAFLEARVGDEAARANRSQHPTLLGTDAQRDLRVR